jgi:hypothetical protein
MKMETTKKRTPLPLIAGILAITAGGFKLFGILGIIAYGFFAIAPPTISKIGALGLFLGAVIPLIILVALAILGGIFAIQRKRFGLALTGAIAALLPFSPLGLASIILLAISKEEFE